MKWIKFKHELPTRDCFITDWKSVWTSLVESSPFRKHWAEYAMNNPEYAWAEILLPDVPVEEKELHKCEYMALGICCYEEKACAGNTNLLLKYEDKFIVFVNFCPICGYSPKEKNG